MIHLANSYSLCRRRDLNPHIPCNSIDFESKSLPFHQFCRACADYMLKYFHKPKTWQTDLWIEMQCDKTGNPHQRFEFDLAAFSYARGVDQMWHEYFQCFLVVTRSRRHIDGGWLPRLSSSPRARLRVTKLVGVASVPGYHPYGMPMTHASLPSSPS